MPSGLGRGARSPAEGPGEAGVPSPKGPGGTLSKSPPAAKAPHDAASPCSPGHPTDDPTTASPDPDPPHWYGQEYG